jgi:hypothetical protein
MVNSMQVETKFLRLRTPVTIGSLFGDWVVTSEGGWTRDRLSHIVMVAKIEDQPLAMRRKRTAQASVEGLIAARVNP